MSHFGELVNTCTNDKSIKLVTDLMAVELIGEPDWIYNMELCRVDHDL
jgi:hypothetical protein